eukprot:gene26383-biopygen16212
MQSKVSSQRFGGFLGGDDLLRLKADCGFCMEATAPPTARHHTLVLFAQCQLYYYLVDRRVTKNFNCQEPYLCGGSGGGGRVYVQEEVPSFLNINPTTTFY